MVRTTFVRPFYQYSVRYWYSVGYWHVAAVLWQGEYAHGL